MQHERRFRASKRDRAPIRPFAELLVALRFLTRLPVPFVRTLDAPPLDAAMTMFPLAGAIIGALTSTALILAGFAGLPELLTAAWPLPWGSRHGRTA